MHHPADLLVATDNRIHLSPSRRVGQVSRVLLERLKLHLGVGIGDPLAPANAGQRRQELLVSDIAHLLDEPANILVVAQTREEIVLDREVLVFELLCFVVRAPNELQRASRHPRLGPPRDAGQALEMLAERLAQRSHVDPRLLQEGTCDSTVLLEHGQDDMLRLQLGVAESRGLFKRALKGLSALGRHPVGAHRILLPRHAPARWLGAHESL